MILLGRAKVPPKPLANDCVNDSEPSNKPSIFLINLNESNDNNILGDDINGQHSRENSVDIVDKQTNLHTGGKSIL